MREFSRRLQQQMQQAGISPAEMSRRTGITPPNMSRLLNSKREPLLSTACRVLKELPPTTDIRRLLFGDAKQPKRR